MGGGRRALYERGRKTRLRNWLMVICSSQSARASSNWCASWRDVGAGARVSTSGQPSGRPLLDARLASHFAALKGNYAPLGRRTTTLEPALQLAQLALCPVSPVA